MPTKTITCYNWPTPQWNLAMRYWEIMGDAKKPNHFAR
jgi:hypothetical protein